MFDPVTASLLQAAPPLPGLESDEIPQLLTQRYAELVSARLRGADDAPPQQVEWPLERIADTYELVASVIGDEALKKASAFVAATAHQILSRQALKIGRATTPPLHRDGVAPAVAAGILFLAAEQYADANEAASAMPIDRQEGIYEVGILAENLRDLCAGRLGTILERAARWRASARTAPSLEIRAMQALMESLITGVELLAGEVLSRSAPTGYGRFDSARRAFELVLEMSQAALKGPLAGLAPTYAGPRHLAALLLSASDALEPAALTRVPPPSGADNDFWLKWLQHRARKAPYVWPNHRQAIDLKFYETGKSAVMVLPTGAGKTTVSSLKIAGTLARRKKVVFLAPTHALVEQLTEDLQEMFPEDLLGSVVSSDFDLLMVSDATLKEIEVMTPERCLAMLSFAPEVFSDVGLLVFDECHLLSPQSGKIRRSLDGMLCLLSFNRAVPDADTLFLSAMLRDGQDFAEWIQNLTGRECIFVELLWKPSRQARGVVIFKEEELTAAKAKALAVQARLDSNAKRAKGLRSAAQRELMAQPWAIWGLQHNWLSQETQTAICSVTPVSEDIVHLTGELSGRWVRLKPNANHVAAKLAVAAAQRGLKTIVFVNTKADAVSAARDISSRLEVGTSASSAEEGRWEALELELGDLCHSLLRRSDSAVPHNSSMLRLERDLAERTFRRSDGAQVIVATPTLAQGLNLPAQLAILAGDKRASAEKKGRENLEAHELLNAAARAGRAGHLANGVVLLVPEPPIGFSESEPLTRGVVAKLQSIFPEDDRCVSISDPLEVILDRLMQGRVADRDVRYTINRMAAIQDTEHEPGVDAAFNLKKSLAAFTADKRAQQQEFESRLAALQTAVAGETKGDTHRSILSLSSQTGLPAGVLQRLRGRLEIEIGSLPTNVVSWTTWTVEWLSADAEAADLLLHDVARAIAGATGRNKDSAISREALNGLIPGIVAWLSGMPLSAIETQLGGDPNGGETQRVCPRARDLVGTVIPRGLSFIVGIVAHVVEELDPFDGQEDLDRGLIESLGSAVRRGFDSVDKLSFATERKHLFGRVQAHLAWSQEHRDWH